MQNPDLLIHKHSPQVNLSAKDIARFWGKVNTGGPTMPHMATACWEWTAGRTASGYGQFQVKKLPKKGPVKAHRIAFILGKGPISKGLWVLHKCDNPLCCNPSHLYLGTHTENVADKVSRNRQSKGVSHSSIMLRVAVRGDNHPARLHPERVARGDKNGARLHPERLLRGEDVAISKLTNGMVASIKARYIFRKTTYKQLAAEFGVSYSTIERVVTNKTWRHINHD